MELGAKDFLVKVQAKEGAATAVNADSVGAEIARILAVRLPDNPAKIGRTESVGASVGNELTTKAITAILISFWPFGSNGASASRPPSRPCTTSSRRWRFSR